MRRISTRVLPAPAEASTQTVAEGAVTAWCWEGVRSASRSRGGGATLLAVDAGTGWGGPSGARQRLAALIRARALDGLGPASRGRPR